MVPCGVRRAEGRTGKAGDPRMRTRLGRLLRRWADRIDPGHAPRKSGYSYTVERRTRNPNGIAVHIDGTGCPFWVLPEDTHRAFSEAATDWRSPDEKLAAMLEAHGEPKEDT